MRRKLLNFFSLIILFGCKSQNELPVAQEIPTVELCANVNGIGHVIPLPGTTRRMRWFVDLTVVSTLGNLDKTIPQKGDKLRYSIHSPSRSFGNSPADSQDKIFLIKLSKFDKAWTLLNAEKNEDLCPN